MSRRRSRAASPTRTDQQPLKFIVRDWALLLIGLGALVRDLFFVDEWPATILLRIALETMLATLSFLTPGGLFETFFERIVGAAPHPPLPPAPPPPSFPPPPPQPPTAESSARRSSPPPPP